MNPQPVQMFTMSSDELSYLIRRFDVDVVPGLARNSLISLSEPQQELASRIIEHSLAARKYLTIDPDGAFLIEPQLESALKLMIRCAYVLVMTTNLTPSAPPEVTICFISPNVVISEIFPSAFAHDIAVYLEPLDFAQDIANFIPECSGQSVAIDITLQRSEWEGFLAKTWEGEPQFSPLIQQVMLARQFLVQSVQGIDLSLTPLLEDKLVTKMLSIRWTENTCLFATDEDISDIDGQIHIQRVTKAELHHSLKAWLTPVQPARIIDSNG